MKTILLITAILSALTAPARETPDPNTASSVYKAQYLRQVKLLGITGVGVETILGKWEEASPEDVEMLEGKFNYYFVKSQSSVVEAKKQPKYLGQKPMFSLKDSTGAAVNYFQETMYDDSLFAISSSAIDKAVSLKPHELKYRFEKITALTSYEKESPDMALSELMKLIDMDKDSHPSWTYEGQEADSDLFVGAMQEYCHSFFTIGSPNSYESFRNLSEKLCKAYPKVSDFQSNIGSYWKVVKNNDKKALSYYKKALKLNPDDAAARQNMKLIQTSQSHKGQPSK